MFTILDYSSALEYSIIRRYTNIVYYIIVASGCLSCVMSSCLSYVCIVSICVCI